MSVKFLFQKDVAPAQYFPNMLLAVIGENATLKAQAAKNDYPGLIQTVTENAEKILAFDDDIELDNIISVLVSFIPFLKNRKDLEVVNPLIEAIKKNPTEKAEFKINTLQLIFNTLPVDCKSRYFAFSAILNIALEAGLTAMIPGDFSYVNSWAEFWGVTPAMIAELIYTVSRVCEANGEKDLAAKFVYEYLSTSTADVSEVCFRLLFLL